MMQSEQIYRANIVARAFYSLYESPKLFEELLSELL